MFNTTEGVRENKLPRNNAFIEAMEYYYSMMTMVGTRCGTGMNTLFGIQSCGVDLSTVIPPDANWFTGHTVDYAPSDLLRNSLADKNYTALCLTSNLKAWIDLLVTSLTQRVTDYVFTPNGTDTVPRYDLGQQRFYSYAPGDATIERMLKVIAVSGKMSDGPSWGNIVEQDLWLAVEALKVTADSELHGIINADGRAMPSQLRKTVMLQWCTWVNSLTDIPTGDFKRILLPVFRICLSLVRMLYGQVAHLGEESHLQVLGEDMRQLQISNETLLCIPAVTIDTVTTMQERDGPLISTLGLCYVDRLMAFYRCDHV